MSIVVSIVLHSFIALALSEAGDDPPVPVPAKDQPPIDWTVDIRTGQIEDRALEDVLKQFHLAASESPAARLKKLEACYRSFSEKFKRAPEIDLIYSCELIRVGLGSVAKKHLDQRMKAELATYWPAHRLKIFLLSTDQPEAVVARQLSVMSEVLIQKESRADVLRANVMWLGQALEGLRLSQSDHSDVKEALQACEKTLHAYGQDLADGAQAARRRVKTLAIEKEAAVTKIALPIEKSHTELLKLDEGIQKKKEKLAELNDTLSPVQAEFERAIAPSVATVNRLESDLLKHQQQVDDARKSVDSKRADYELKKANQKNAPKGQPAGNVDRTSLDHAERHLKMVEDRLLPVQKQYDTAKNQYNLIVSEFNRKYSPSIKLRESLEKEIPRDLKKREEKEKGVRTIEKNQRAAAAIHAVDFLRPDVNQILGELASGIKQK